MSLLHVSDEKVNRLARIVYDKHFELDPKLGVEYDDRRKRLMYEDILYNLSYLDTAIRFNDNKIFPDYAVWLYQLLCHLMKNLDRERIKEHMVLHYQILNDILQETLPEEEAQKASYHLQKAIEVTENEAIQFQVSDRFAAGKYGPIKKEYLNCILNNDTKGALQVVTDAEKSGIPIDEICVEILQEVMCEIGNLWHQDKIKVDKEHYCTAVTQVAMSQFHPIIFSKPRNGYTILTCCVGSELHEMGIRMVSDVFENNGWDSIYLGAAVPNDAILNCIEENRPDLVALSVTMPQHLALCFDIVNEIREKYQDIKIAVGGRAFQTTDELWKQWDVDIAADNAVQLVLWADEHIVKKMRGSS